MKINQLICPGCGGKLVKGDEPTQYFCEHCGGSFIVENEQIANAPRSRSTTQPAPGRSTYSIPVMNFLFPREVFRAAE